jgi:hypothetical protein
LSEPVYRGILETAADAIIAVDSAGLVVFANAQADRLFGYTSGALVGLAIDMLVPEPARGAHAARRAGYFSNPRPRPMGAGVELAARRKDGTEFPAEISLSGIQTDEGLLVSAAVRDLTDRIATHAERERLKAAAEREHLENRLAQAQRLESLGQLAGGVAHDFNNLLGAIMNYTEFVGEEVAAAGRGEVARDWASVERDVAQIRRATDRAAQLTRQLLAFARREVVRPQVIDLNDVVNEVEELLRRTIGEHVRLQTTLGECLWPVVADKGQLEQVLVNLAVNARDAMPAGGSLTIDTENLFVDDEYAVAHGNVQVGSHVRLRVSDSGTGMAPEVTAHAFEPFFTTKPRGEGTGLGLAQVYGIVTQSGGDVQIYSDAGFGTTVSVLLPATGQQAWAPDVPPEPGHAHGGETVLVVEDEEAMRDVATRILQRDGYVVIAASSGPEALELARDHEGPIDLLLTDVVMPRMLGREVAERMSELRPGLRVLYMSGYAQPVLGDRGVLDDGTHLLEKPFSERQLRARVVDVLWPG